MSKRGCLKKILIYSYCFGIAAHGNMMFNKLSWHDDLAYGRLLSFGGVVSLGRWLRAILAYAVAVLMNGNNMSLPLFHGLISIFFIALSTFILIQIFYIENDILQDILCGLLVTFPVVTGTFGYMFTAPYYFFALFLAVYAVYFEVFRSNTVSFVVSSAFICCSLGIYQAYFSVSVSCFVLLIIIGIIEHRFDSIKTIFLQGIRYILICVCGLVEYLIIWKVFLRLCHESTSNYQGLSTMGTSGLSNYIEGISNAYRLFFLHSNYDASCNLFPLRGSTILEWAIIVTCVAISVILVINTIRKDFLKGLLLFFLIGILPLCFNLICLISAATPHAYVHTLMLYANIMLYVYCVWLLQYILRNKTRITCNVYRVSALFMALMLLMNVYFANVCYLKAEILQQQTISEMTVLITRIKSIEHYKDDMPVSIILTDESDSTRTDNSVFDDIVIKPFGLRLNDPFSSDRNLKNCLSIWCGFSPEFVDTESFENMKVVEEMPAYPDDGSIRIINNTVVVKL